MNTNIKVINDTKSNIAYLIEKEKLDDRDKYLVKELNQIFVNILFSENFKDYEWLSIRNNCQIEYDFYIKEFNKNTDINNFLFRFSKSVNERVIRDITEENKFEYIKCLELFVEFYKNEIKRQYIKLI